MFERFKQRSSTADQDRGTRATAVAADDRVADDHVSGDTVVREGNGGRVRTAGDGTATAETMRTVRARQREEYGGINWGAAFFGWLVAVGMAAILLGLLSAAGAAFGLSEVSDAEAEANAETIGIVGGILLIVVLGIAYYCGGYVSGRMSRFDGGRQGLGVWVLGLLVTIVLAVAGGIFGAEYNVLERLNFPRIPIEEGSLTAGAAITLAAVVLATLLLAMGGGKAGERYHKKIDRAGYERV